MIFIKELRQNPARYYLPERFAAIFDEYCEHCDSPMELSEDLADYQCSNPECITVKAGMVQEIMKQAGIEDAAYREAEGMLTLNKWENPYQIFHHSPRKRYYSQITKKRQKQIARAMTESRSMSLAEYIGYGGTIPMEKSLQYFKDCRTIKDCLQKMQDMLNTAARADEIDLSILQDYYRLSERKTILEEGMMFMDMEV